MKLVHLMKQAEFKSEIAELEDMMSRARDDADIMGELLMDEVPALIARYTDADEIEMIDIHDLYCEAIDKIVADSTADGDICKLTAVEVVGFTLGYIEEVTR